MSKTKILEVRAIGADPSLSQVVADPNFDWRRVPYRLEILDESGYPGRIIRLSDSKEVARGKNIVAYLLDDTLIFSHNAPPDHDRPDEYQIGTMALGHEKPTMLIDPEDYDSFVTVRFMAGSWIAAVNPGYDQPLPWNFIDVQTGDYLLDKANNLVEASDIVPLQDTDWVIHNDLTQRRNRIFSTFSLDYVLEKDGSVTYEVGSSDDHTFAVALPDHPCYMINAPESMLFVWILTHDNGNRYAVEHEFNSKIRSIKHLEEKDKTHSVRVHLSDDTTQDFIIPAA